MLDKFSAVDGKEMIHTYQDSVCERVIFLIGYEVEDGGSHFTHTVRIQNVR